MDEPKFVYWPRPFLKSQWYPLEPYSWGVSTWLMILPSGGVLIRYQGGGAAALVRDEKMTEEQAQKLLNEVEEQESRFRWDQEQYRIKEARKKAAEPPLPKKKHWWKLA